MTRAQALRHVLSGACLKRAIIIMLVVGTILNIINQGETLMKGGDIDWAKGILTFLVPFCVACFSAWGSVLDKGKTAS